MNNEVPEMKNETEVQSLCKRGCGFYGSVQFGNMCSKCYQEQLKNDNEKMQSPSSSSLVLQTSLNEHSVTPKDNLSISTQVDNQVTSSKLTAVGVTMRTGSDNTLGALSPTVLHTPKRKYQPLTCTKPEASTSSSPQPIVRRCSWCRKRVGLTGFTCRCDGLFCSVHRYSDQHECKFDYQAHGRVELSKSNPEVRCAKIRKL